MAKKNFKEFVKEHKYEIAMGCLTVVAGVVGVTLYRSIHGTTDLRIEAYAKSEEAKQCLERIYEFAAECDQIAEGASMYTGWKADEAVAMFGDNIYTDADGDTLKITGAILFGNKVNE